MTEIPAEPTQVRRPWRATARTAVQVAIPLVLALGLVVPEVVEIILDEAGANMPDKLRVVLLGAAAAVTAVAAALARIMAIPSVELFLRRYKLVSGLAARPGPSSDPVVDEGGHMRLFLTIVAAVVLVAVLFAVL